MLLVYVGAYVALGLPAIAVWQRLEPSDWYTVKDDGTLEMEPDEAGDPPQTVVLLAALLLWPLWLTGLAFKRFTKANMQSLNNKTKLRAELETELAAAKKEIDDLLRAK